MVAMAHGTAATNGVTVHGERAFSAARISFATLAVGSAAMMVALRRILNGE